MAELFVVPQLYSARNLGMELSRWPRLQAAERACMQLPAFYETHPENLSKAIDVSDPILSWGETDFNFSLAI